MAPRRPHIGREALAPDIPHMVPEALKIASGTPHMVQKPQIWLQEPLIWNQKPRMWF